MNRFAILIGSSKFEKDKSLTELRCPENDVDAMHEIVTAEEIGVFKPPDLCKNFAHHKVLDKISATLASAGSKDQVLIYYSGHGRRTRSGKLYLTTPNTEAQKLHVTSIPLVLLYEMIADSNCQKVILILDCCYAGAGTKDDPAQALKEFADGKGIYLLAASTANQTALEKEGDDLSLLTKHIVHGIKSGEAARVGEEYISVGDVYRYVYEKVTDESHQKPIWDVEKAQGKELYIARVANVFTVERLQILEDQVLERKTDLPRKVRNQALHLIGEYQPNSRLPAQPLKLLEEWVAGRMKHGKFLDEWEALNLKTEAEPKGEAPPKQSAPPVIKAEAKPDRIVAPKSFTETINGVPLEMILVPAGKFRMGSDKNDRETPPHEVTVPSFYIGKFQITQAQWKALMGEEVKPYFSGNDLPMESVSWQDAQAFCEKLRAKTGKAFRLPSEAEWEYACRAGTTGDYAGELDAMAWYNDNSENKPHPVGQKNPNAFGLYDMHGNVWEWCEDIWHLLFNTIPTDGSARVAPENSKRRILRGGAWCHNGENCRSALRNNYASDARNTSIGFRVVVAARTS